MNNDTIKTVKQQNKDRWFKMKLKFNLTIGSEDIDNMMQLCGFSEKPRIKDGMQIDLMQTINFIPDQNTIKGYETIIKHKYNNDGNGIVIDSCNFAGYEYLYEVDEPEEIRTK